MFEELLVNALVYRDYFINAPTHLLIFVDRVEIVSPGHLPNHLDVEQIRYDISNLRNAALASHAFHLLPYSGLGSGIPRAAAAWAKIELSDDRRGNQFRAVVRRETNLSDADTRQVADKLPTCSPQQLAVLQVAENEASRAKLQETSGFMNREHFVDTILKPLLELGLLEMTNPEKPRSSKQRYRITEKGRKMLEGGSIQCDYS